METSIATFTGAHGSAVILDRKQAAEAIMPIFSRDVHDRPLDHAKREVKRYLLEVRPTRNTTTGSTLRSGEPPLSCFSRDLPEKVTRSVTTATHALTSAPAHPLTNAFTGFGHTSSTADLKNASSYPPRLATSQQTGTCSERTLVAIRRFNPTESRRCHLDSPEELTFLPTYNVANASVTDAKLKMLQKPSANKENHNETN